MNSIQRARRDSKLPIEQRQNAAKRERLVGLSEVEIVKNWYTTDDPYELTESEDRIRQRWDLAKSLFLQRKTYAQTVEMLMSECGISIAQARVDIRNMRATFGPIDEVPKIARRQLAIEMSLEAFELAKTGKDVDGMTKATKAYIQAAGLDKEDAEPFDLEKLMKDRTYVEILDPQIRTLFLNLLAQGGGVLDTTMMFKRATDAKDEGSFVDYETINDDDERTNTE